MRAARLQDPAPAACRDPAPALQPVPAPQPMPAPFVAMDNQAIDAPMWPIHTVVWFQPELTPGVPRGSGLCIERHYRIPMPDFLNAPLHTLPHPDVTPPSQTDTTDDTRDPLPPNLRPQLPHSGLEPLGWDPRAVAGSCAAPRKEEGK
jgi:hypothetical protein